MWHTRTNMVSLSPSLLLISTTLASFVRIVSAQQCTTCFGGAEPTNLGGTSAIGVSCAFLDRGASSAQADSSACQTLQLSAFQGCGCPTFDESAFCAMCDDGFYEIPSRNKPVPLFMEDVNCGDLVLARRTSGFCGDLPRAAYFCTWIGLTLAVVWPHVAQQTSHSRCTFL